MTLQRGATLFLLANGEFHDADAQSVRQSADGARPRRLSLFDAHDGTAADARARGEVELAESLAHTQAAHALSK
jgi:hypothetical protein